MEKLKDFTRDTNFGPNSKRNTENKMGFKIHENNGCFLTINKTSNGHLTKSPRRYHTVGKIVHNLKFQWGTFQVLWLIHIMSVTKNCKG